MGRDELFVHLFLCPSTRKHPSRAPATRDDCIFRVFLLLSPSEAALRGSVRSEALPDFNLKKSKKVRKQKQKKKKKSKLEALGLSCTSPHRKQRVNWQRLLKPHFIPLVAMIMKTAVVCWSALLGTSTTIHVCFRAARKENVQRTGARATGPKRPRTCTCTTVTEFGASRRATSKILHSPWTLTDGEMNRLTFISVVYPGLWAQNYHLF